MSHPHPSIDPPLPATDLATWRERFRAARRVVVLTGAGISAESGVPTFRQAQAGLWARYRAEDLATPEAFERDPDLVWSWYAGRREKVLSVQPNAGHHALAALAERAPELVLVTQNVDGLHQRAGSRDVIELHGSIHRLHPFGLAQPDVDDSADWPQPPGEQPSRDASGRLLRPSVVWFGEALPERALAAAIEAAERADVFLAIGTSALVQPAASLPLLARERGAWTVEVNPQETALSGQVDLVLRGAAGQILPQLVAALD